LLTPQPTDNSNAPGDLLVFLSGQPSMSYAERAISRFGGRQVLLTFPFSELESAGIEVEPGGFSYVDDPDSGESIKISAWHSAHYNTTRQPIPLSLLTADSKRNIIQAIALDLLDRNERLNPNQLEAISKALAMNTEEVSDLVTVTQNHYSAVPVTVTE